MRYGRPIKDLFAKKTFGHTLESKLFHPSSNKFQKLELLT